MSFARSILDWVGERRQEDYFAIPRPSQEIMTSAGIPVNEERALRQLTVWACVALISDTGSTLPVGAFRKEGGYPRQLQDPRVLQDPHVELDVQEWLQMMYLSILLRGNAFGRVIERDSELGYPTQIEPVHPDKIIPKRDPKTKALKYKISGEKDLVPRIDIFHVRGLTLPGSRIGLNPIEYARQTIGTALGAEEFGANFFGEGGHPSGALSTDQKLSEEDSKRFQEKWLEAHGNRHRRPAVLSGGLKWEPISLKPEESQFLDTIRAKKSDIAGFYRVPPHMIADVQRSTSWGTGIEEQGIQFVTFTMGIWIVKFERALSRLLPRGQYVKFNVASLLRARLLDRYQSYLMARQGSWLNIDEIRDLEERPPLEDGVGQIYSQPLNWGPIPGQPGAVVPEAPVEPEPPQAPPGTPSS